MFRTATTFVLARELDLLACSDTVVDLVEPPPEQAPHVPATAVAGNLGTAVGQHGPGRDLRAGRGRLRPAVRGLGPLPDVVARCSCAPGRSLPSMFT
jgi:hypothetical protein